MDKEFNTTLSIICVIVFILSAIGAAYVEYQTSKTAPVPTMLGD